ncbi:hypothetical protein KM92DES2_20396 [uncultured Desulfovibrio sp.]|uniref:Uncharacterized protein n=1 Tax=uncultured Desulfovibrio sp. TaxID=167968 RepID=A0A212KKQ7_9BACT|nr:hypothetical protein KM92DES2_20396 [uncultured Desulfovibrio sp.]
MIDTLSTTLLSFALIMLLQTLNPLEISQYSYYMQLLACYIDAIERKRITRKLSKTTVLRRKPPCLPISRLPENSVFCSYCPWRLFSSLFLRKTFNAGRR